MITRKAKRKLVADDDSVVKERRTDILYIYDLPDDVYSCIFSYCDLSSLGRLAISCKYMNELVNRDDLGASSSYIPKLRDLVENVLSRQLWDDSHKIMDLLVGRFEDLQRKLWETEVSNLITLYFPNSKFECEILKHSDNEVKFALLVANTSYISFVYSKIPTRNVETGKLTFGYFIRYRSDDEDSGDDSVESESDEEGFRHLLAIENEDTAHQQRFWTTWGGSIDNRLTSIAISLGVSVGYDRRNGKNLVEFLLNVCTKGKYGKLPLGITDSFQDAFYTVGELWKLPSHVDTIEWMNGKHKMLPFVSRLAEREVEGEETEFMSSSEDEMNYIRRRKKPNKNTFNLAMVDLSEESD